MPERTNKRDRYYSAAHFCWGHLPHTDIDSMEYDDDDNAIALVETKYSYQSQISLSGIDDHEIRKHLKTSTKLGIPFFVVVYWFFHYDYLLDSDDYGKLHPTHKQFFVVPMNELARGFVAEPSKMTEQQWVEVLHAIHGKKCVMRHNNTWRPVKLPKVVK